MGSLLGADTDQVRRNTFAGIATLAGVAYLALRPARLRTENVVLGLVSSQRSSRRRFFGRATRIGLYFLGHADSRYVYVSRS
jgi:hypothetical protein